MDHQRTHVVMPKDLLADNIDQLFGKGKRSAFLTEIAERELRKEKLVRALDDAAGCWKTEDHPELAKGSAAFVKALRSESDAVREPSGEAKVRRAHSLCAPFLKRRRPVADQKFWADTALNLVYVTSSLTIN
jgi:hypothetical protein